MSLKKGLEDIHQFLLQARIDHALIGGFALAAHGNPRATGDIDLLIDEKDRPAVTQSLQSNGFSIRSETIEVIHFEGPVRLDVLFARRPLSRRMLSEAAQEPHLFGIKVVGPEDLIGLKIQAYKNNPKRKLQDQADIQFLLERFPQLDLTRVKQYADIFNEWATIENLKKGNS